MTSREGESDSREPSKLAMDGAQSPPLEDEIRLLQARVRELERERDEFRLLAASPRLVTLLFDTSLRLHGYSEGASSLCGLTSGDLGKHIAELPLPGEGVDEQVRTAAACQPQRSTLEVQDGSGRWFTREVSLPASEALGDPRIVVSLVEDSPVRERLRLATEAAQVGVFEWHIPTDANIWTPEIEALYGLPPGGFAGSYAAWRACVHPDDLDEAERRMQRSLRTGTFAAEWRAVWPDGSQRWLEARAWVEKDERGEPLRMIGVNLDITERKRVEQARKETDERHTLALESGSLGTFTYDPGTHSVHMDARAQEVFELPGTETTPIVDAIKAVHPDDREPALAALSQALEHREEYAFEKRILRPDGGVRWVRTRGQVVEGRSKEAAPYLIGVVQDITEQKQTEDALKRANRRKDEYLAMLGHELRNPLAAIRTTGELIKMSSAGSPDLERCSDVLERQSAHMVKLVDGLLDVSRITQGKLRTEKAAVELVSMLRDVVSDRRSQAAREGIALEVDLDCGELWLMGDRARLTQVFDNLLGNALKFTLRGGTVTLRMQSQPSSVRVSVCDDGVGFEADLRERLFEPFQQGPQDIARSEGGLGLGLALARNLIELHDGTVEGRSEGRGQGATFTVTLPVSSVPAARTKPAPVQKPAGLRILLIEDNEDSAEMMMALLSLSGHRAELATRGADGVLRARSQLPDVVVCDLGLPEGMSGLDVARALRQAPETRSLRLVALSGYGRPEDKRRCHEAGFDAHLTKPVDRRTLERALRPTGMAAPSGPGSAGS